MDVSRIDSSGGMDASSPALARSHAAFRIRKKGIHQSRSFVRIVQPNDQGISPREAVHTKPIGPKILPSSPTSVIGQ